MQPFSKNAVENNIHISKKLRLNSGSEHDVLISTANEIFGLNSWSHSIVRRDIDYIDCNNGRYSVGISVIVKVQLKTGIYHEELGYGICNGSEDKGSAIALAQQDAAIQGLREALSSFGGELTKRLSQSQSCRPPEVSQSCRPPEVSQSCRPPEVKVENHSPTETVFRPPVNTSPSTEDEIKLERKRRQQKKREEFLQQMKQKQIQLNSAVSNKENGPNAGRVNSLENDFMGTLDMDDEALISTQEMDRMVQSAAAAQSKPRIPLLCSPPNTIIETSGSWVPARPNRINNVAPRNLLIATKNLDGPYKNGRL